MCVCAGVRACACPEVFLGARAPPQSVGMTTALGLACCHSLPRDPSSPSPPPLADLLLPTVTVTAGSTVQLRATAISAERATSTVDVHVTCAGQAVPPSTPTTFAALPTDIYVRPPPRACQMLWLWCARACEGCGVCVDMPSMARGPAGDRSLATLPLCPLRPRVCCCLSIAWTMVWAVSGAGAWGVGVGVQEEKPVAPVACFPVSDVTESLLTGEQLELVEKGFFLDMDGDGGQVGARPTA